jgi:hypothetical protein
MKKYRKPLVQWHRVTSQTLPHHPILLLLKFHSNFTHVRSISTLFSDSVSKAMNSNMVGRRIHKPMEGKSFKEGSWNNYHLYAQPMTITCMHSQWLSLVCTANDYHLYAQPMTITYMHSQQKLEGSRKVTEMERRDRDITGYRKWLTHGGLTFGQ